MIAVSTRPANNHPYARLNRAPINLVDAVLADWFGAPAAAAVAPTPSVLRARIDVVERSDAYEVRAELPGVRKSDIDIEVDGTRVSLKARVAQARDKNDSDKNDSDKLIYSERSHAAYERSFDLPEAVDPARAAARFEDGVLTLTLPKLEAARSTRVSIE
jgi:HSP20 family protein